MKNRKLLASILALVLSISMTACGKSDESSKSAETEATTVTTTESTTTTPQESETEATTTTAPVETEKPATSIDEESGEEYVLIEGKYSRLNKKTPIRLNCKSDSLDITLENLSKFPSTIEIKIKASEESDYPYEELSKVTNTFENVSLDWSDSSDLSGVQYFTNATEILLDGCTDTDLSPVNKLTNIKELNLDGYKTNDLSPISNMTNLVSLYIGDYDGDLSPISNMTNLVSLDLGDRIIDDVTVFYNLVNLHELKIHLADNYLTTKHYTADSYQVLEGGYTVEDTYNEPIYDNEELKKLHNYLDDTQIKYIYENEYDSMK